MRTIVVAFDESEPAERALHRAADLAQAFDAQLVVISVAVPPVPSSAFDTVLPGAAGQLAEDASEQLDLADQHLARARELLEERGVTADYVSQAGTPADAIVRLAEERDADVIVVGTREPGFLERLLQPSVSEDVTHHTRRDVLIVH